jgi:hypothetical protein
VHLDEAWAHLKEEGNPHIITRYRDTRTNLRTQLLGSPQGGPDPWEKPWQNLRSTRQTRLAAD